MSERKVNIIHLRCDPALYFKMREHKAGLEKKLGNSLTWESYISHLFFREAPARKVQK